MASTEPLLSRLLDLVKYGEWNKDDVVELFSALVKQYRVRAEKTDFYPWVAKILYQVEIHKIKKSDLLSDIEARLSEDDIEVRIDNLVQETKEKSLDNILKEIQAEGDIDQNILKDVKDIVMSVSSASHPLPTRLQDIKEKLAMLCNAVNASKKWRPRCTQMVSWCIMACSGSSQLIQVGTGEGKSCIVAMFAAYCAMIKKSVDIISSSPVLAERDAKEWRKFYEDLKITVDCNTNKTEAKDLKKCYACNVVYGTTESFSGDWLRDRFQREDLRSRRQFQCVIIDEVDSLMLDKGLEVVYINREIPVMEPLNIILAKIWFVVNQSEDRDVERTLDLIHSSLMAEDSDILPKHKYGKISADTSKLQPNEFHIPGFLEHINGRLKIWIENAFLAKTMTLGHEYILHEDGVVPVDYSSTGVVQNNMKWGDGLQQFLEMKHQTKLSNMGLITNFKSNVNLFRSYERINGLTGTLGTQTEFELLQKLYPGIKTCKIPPFKRRKLYEKDGIVIHNENEWVQTICNVVKENVKPTVYRGSRAVLVICETIKQAETVHNALSGTISTNNLKLYTNNNMDNSKITGETVTEGCVIVATNLAGRGTDFKVCKEVNGSGGLFVVQTFLPLNIRVERQAFGRTAREGNPGSAQLIMCSTHFSESIKLMIALNLPLRLLTLLKRLTTTVAVSAFVKHKFGEMLKTCQDDPKEQKCEEMGRELRGLLNSEDPSTLSNLKEEKESRDLIVQIRMSQFLDDDIPKIIKKEELFSEYLTILDTVYKEKQGGDTLKDIVSSLHECWGMWLLMKFDENESTETLREQLKKDMQSAKQKLYCNESPSSMIYHYVRTGNTLHHKSSLVDSIAMYTRAIENNPCWPAIALYNRALSILSKASSGYITQALADLKKAEEAVDSYLRNLTLTSIFVEGAITSSNMTSETLLGKQFKAKRQAQISLKLNIQQAIKVLQTAESQGYDVQLIKYPVALLMLNPAIFRVGGFIGLVREIINLDSLGLDTIFSLEIVRYSFFQRLTKIFG